MTNSSLWAYFNMAKDEQYYSATFGVISTCQKKNVPSNTAISPSKLLCPKVCEVDIICPVVSV